MSTARRKRSRRNEHGKESVPRVCVSTASSVLDGGLAMNHARTRSSGPENVLRTQRLSEAVFGLRRRRSVDRADVLLDECLALLDTVAELWPFARVTLSRPETARHAGIAAASDESIPELDGDSPAIDRLKDDIACVARDAYVSVLIRGESGTGKERIARAIHRLSSRAGGPFVVVNCAGLTPTLTEDELFGHVRGAFTGAAADRPGPFERANGGTVFLDEIGELTADAQMKLLRALQQRTVQRLGSGQETPFDARVIAATNADLESAQQRGRFRQDLYYRLKVYELHAPPLRRRGVSDLRQLTGAILQCLSTQRRRSAPVLGAGVWDAFTRHSWPGNVRELENTLERMIVAAGDDALLIPAHMPDELREVFERSRSPVLEGGEIRPRRSMPSAAEARAVLQRNDLKHGKTAVELGLSRHQLYRLLKRRAVDESPAGQAPA
jgi:two-component system NtrC family response regulator